jgi:hypothetical protein
MLLSALVLAETTTPQIETITTTSLARGAIVNVVSMLDWQAPFSTGKRDAVSRP